MRVLSFIILALFGAISIPGFCGDGTDISLEILVNDQSNELVIGPTDEVRVNFLATNEGPSDLDFMLGGFTGLIENFSFPFDIDCQNLGIAQVRGFDPTDYIILWQISPLAVGETRECRFSLRALSSTSKSELIEIQYAPTTFEDPDPSDDVAGFLINFVQVPMEAIAVPVLSAKTLAVLILSLLVLGAANMRSRTST